MEKDLVLVEDELATLSLATLIPPGPLDRNPAAVYLASLPSPESRRTLGATLEVIAGLLSGGKANAAQIPWGSVRYAHTAALRSALLQRYKPATTNKYLAVVRGVLRQSVRLGLMDLATYQSATDFKGVKGETLPSGRALAAGELRALVTVCHEDPGPGGVRDVAVLALLYGCGLRRAEAAGLQLEDVDLENGVVTVHGKGRKDRTTHAPPGARHALSRWVETRGPDPGPLLCPVDKAGRLTIRPITAQALYLALQKRAHEAGIPAFSPHDLRRTFVSDLLDAGADLAVVQKLAGHADPGTTARYDRRGEAAKAKAAGMLVFPDAR
jgi:site-specific recombinase XerD